jgi:hypothetical protein
VNFEGGTDHRLSVAISACNTTGITGDNLMNLIHNLNEEEEEELDPEVTVWMRMSPRMIITSVD